MEMLCLSFFAEKKPHIAIIKMKALFALFLLILASLSSITAISPSFFGITMDKRILGEENSGPMKNERSEEAVVASLGIDEQPKQLILAAARTKRPDIIRGFKQYNGGWEVDNKHYWASLGYTGAFGFILSILWFLCFGLAIFAFHCYGWRFNIKGKETDCSQRTCLIMLIIFTCGAVVGSILLAAGQQKFYGEVMHALKYVVNQSDYTVQTLRNVTEYLNLGKTTHVAIYSLPSNINDGIEKLNLRLSKVANTLSKKTTENSHTMKHALNGIHATLITIAAVMLFLALLGLVLSILGHKDAIYVFVLSGWLLVAVSFVLCGVFVILDNAVSDSCMAMREWVDNPQAQMTLGETFPCINQRDTDETLIKSKQVINDIVNVFNVFINAYANSSPSEEDPFYYNPSGPLVPLLCDPFDSYYQDRACAPDEVSLENAPAEWKKYTCRVSPTGLCITPGRLTPDIYTQAVIVVNITYALQNYPPRLLNFQNCNFLRDTFKNITSNYCSPLNHHVHTVVIGLWLISGGVLLCLVLWILYSTRPRTKEEFVQFSPPMKGKFRRFNNDH